MSSVAAIGAIGTVAGGLLGGGGGGGGSAPAPSFSIGPVTTTHAPVNFAPTGAPAMVAESRKTVWVVAAILGGLGLVFIVIRYLRRK